MRVLYGTQVELAPAPENYVKLLNSSMRSVHVKDPLGCPFSISP